MNSIKRIAVVDDHSVFRKGLIRLLKEYDHLNILFEAENGQDLIEKLSSQQPDVILLDIEMPVMNGIEATIHIREKYPEIKIIIITSHYEEELMHHLIEKGAHGFLSKNASIDKIAISVDIVIQKGYYFDFKVSEALAKGIVLNRKLKPEFTSMNLSEREVEILKLICKENTNKEIADKLCLSVRTVDTYRLKIFEKTKVKNAVGLVFYALKYGLIDM